MLIAQTPIYTAYVRILSVRLNYEYATSAELRLGDSDWRLCQVVERIKGTMAEII